jgi:thymidine kinase
MGRIELIIGCMYSGKTTEFMRRIMMYKTLSKKDNKL